MPQSETLSLTPWRVSSLFGEWREARMSGVFRVWFTNITGCAMGISDISWSVTVAAASEAEAVELALERARVVNRGSGLPPHGLRVSEQQLRHLACVPSQRPAEPDSV
jgi:hypothetical protein